MSSQLASLRPRQSASGAFPSLQNRGSRSYRPRRDRFALLCCRPAFRIARFHSSTRLGRSLINKKNISKNRSRRRWSRRLQRMFGSKKFLPLCLGMLHHGETIRIPQADVQPADCVSPTSSHVTGYQLTLMNPAQFESIYPEITGSAGPMGHDAGTKALDLAHGSIPCHLHQPPTGFFVLIFINP